MTIAEQLVGKVVSGFGRHPIVARTVVPTTYGAYVVNGYLILTHARALKLLQTSGR